MLCQSLWGGFPIKMIFSAIVSDRVPFLFQTINFARLSTDSKEKSCMYVYLDMQFPYSSNQNKMNEAETVDDSTFFLCVSLLFFRLVDDSKIPFG